MDLLVPSPISHLFSVHPEMVDFGSGQGRSLFTATGVAALRRGLQKNENVGLDRKTPFMDGHYITKKILLDPLEME